MTAGVLKPVPVEQQTQACLDDAQLAKLVELGRRAEAIYGTPCDLEWALLGEQFWLLQMRPITAGSARGREQVRREEIAALAAKAEAGGTVWSRFNLAEVLPEPTPMTWDIVRGFLSGRGGLGLMYRDLGFCPDRARDSECIYDLVCGRPFCNLSREPVMYANGLPLEHAFAALKADPRKALYPKAQVNWSRAGWRFWLSFPLIFFRSMRLARRLRQVQQNFARHFREKVLPAFATETAVEACADLSCLSDLALLDRLEHWIKRTLCDFARDSLKPTALAAALMTELEEKLTKVLGQRQSESALRTCIMTVRPDLETDLANALQDLAVGRIDRSSFLEKFGHRGYREMELSAPRWAENATALEALNIGQLAVSETPQDSLLTRGSLPTPVWETLERLRTQLALRETAKHYLMKGYGLIRRILLELDRRHGLDGGIFYLTTAELPRLEAGENLAPLIAERQRRRGLALSIEVPQVLFSDDLQVIGRRGDETPGSQKANRLQGIGLSAGIAEGPALVLHQPLDESLPSEPYILVCPSTDPAWVPLFANARGLVMETGGILSHGAIVAREFGLPAVAGIPEVCRLLYSGQRLRVDGATGAVYILTN
jgi:pyruvate,water dikinase